MSVVISHIRNWLVMEQNSFGLYSAS